MKDPIASVAIIGAGLAGSEAALVLAKRNIKVVLYEMRPQVMTPAHKTGLPAELVCSNSFKSDQLSSAHGILKAELSLLKSPLLEAAFENRIPAGSALAVDRIRYSHYIQRELSNCPNITLKVGEVDSLPADEDYCIIAAGPLMSKSLSDWLHKMYSSDSLYFYDAIAPIISADSLDRETIFFASRWDTETADYGNCPFTEDQYKTFYDALISADKLKLHEFEQSKYFEACLPIEVVAARGFLSLPYGIMRPVGLTDPKTNQRPYAVCQLRKENSSGESYNMVGFQTRLTYTEQDRILRLIPGLEKAEFLRYGSIHRNTYINSPLLLAPDLSFKQNSSVFVAGQLCGNEGYTESIATGHIAALFVYSRITQKECNPIPKTTACGALLNHVTQSSQIPFTPSNVHFGLFPPLRQIDSGKKKLPKKEKRSLLAKRALRDFENWIHENLEI